MAHYARYNKIALVLGKEASLLQMPKISKNSACTDNFWILFQNNAFEQAGQVSKIGCSRTIKNRAKRLATFDEKNLKKLSLNINLGILY